MANEKDIGQALPGAFNVAGTALTAYGQYRQAGAYQRYGQRRQEAAEFEAQQYEEAAGQEVAASQREASETRREARLAASRALAIAAASGGGASDPTVVNLIAGLAGEGTYRSMVDLYQGEQRSRQLQKQAMASRQEGANAMSEASDAARAQRFAMIPTVLKGASSLYDKYGKKYSPKQIEAPQWTSGYDIEGAL